MTTTSRPEGPSNIKRSLMPEHVHTRRRRQSETRVRDLAHELGTTSDEILDLARSRNIWVRSPETKISKDNADILRAFWRLRKQVRDHWAEERRTETPTFLAGGTPVDDDPGLATIRAELGVRVPRVSRPRQPRPRVSSEPLTGTAAATVKRWPCISPEYARHIAAEWTGRHWFTETEAAAWWRAGRLGADDAELAAVLRDLGIRPEHLSMMIRGETIRYRLLDGNVPPEHVARLLRNEGYLY